MKIIKSFNEFLPLLLSKIALWQATKYFVRKKKFAKSLFSVKMLKNKSFCACVSKESQAIQNRGLDWFEDNFTGISWNGKRALNAFWVNLSKALLWSHQNMQLG